MKKVSIKKIDIIKNKEIVIKIPEFPHLSETFIIAQILTAIKLGYSIKIITRKLIKNTALISPLIFEHNLLDKVILEDYKIPKNKINRICKWVFILTQNINNLKSIFKFHYSFSKFSLEWLYQWSFYFQFNNASIIHIQYGTYSYPYRILKYNNIFKPKVIVTFHGHDAFFPLYGYMPNNGYYERLFKNNNHITVNTPYLEEKLLEFGCSKNKLMVVPVGVDTSFFYPKIKSQNNKKNKLITVGRLDKCKGQSYSIKIIDKLVRKGINVSLTIIGEGEERDELEKLIKDYNLEENVFLLGNKSQKEVRQALWEHDIYLLTGTSSISGLRESQGLATLEAQACGLPVIVFDSGGIKYTLQDGETGFLCKEFDVDDAVNKVELLLNNNDILNKMGQNAVEFVNRNYSQTVIDDKWELIYNKILNNE